MEKWRKEQDGILGSMKKTLHLSMFQFLKDLMHYFLFIVIDKLILKAKISK